MSLDAFRERKYRELENKIGRTRLVEAPEALPNDNRLFVKLECDNPFGSHYDRVYLALFKQLERAGKIAPGQLVFETTSGSAGVSFAGIGRLLDFTCHVAIPEGGECARERAIREQNATLHHTPAEEYVKAFPLWISQFRREHPGAFFLNHSMGPRGTANSTTLDALAQIAHEVLETDISFDYFLPAIGNGSSVLGPGVQLGKEGIMIIGYESFQSGVAYEMLHADYAARFAIAPGTLSRHHLPGTSYPGIDFPHIRMAVEHDVLDAVMLVSDARMDAEYTERTGRAPPDLPRWDMPETEFDDLGRSTRAGIAVAKRIAQGLHGHNFLIIGYDKAERYDW